MRLANLKSFEGRSFLPHGLYWRRGPHAGGCCNGTAFIAALLGRPDAAPHLGAIRCPVLVGVGRDDRWSPPVQHETIVAAIHGARYVVFEGSGHMAPMEVPEAVTQALRDWMAVPVSDTDGETI